MKRQKHIYGSFSKVYLDGMLGRLTRWLRILGINSVFLGDLDDRKIPEIVSGSNEVFLTRDKLLAKKLLKIGIKVILVPTGNFEDVLAYVCEHLNIVPTVDLDKTLCPICGGRLIRVEKEEVKDRVPEEVYKQYKIFFKCSKCGHIYWLGTHIKEIEKTLEKVRDIIYGKAYC